MCFLGWLHRCLSFQHPSPVSVLIVRIPLLPFVDPTPCHRFQPILFDLPRLLQKYRLECFLPPTLHLSTMTVLPMLFILTSCDNPSFYICNLNNSAHLCLSGSPLRLIVSDSHSLTLLSFFTNARTSGATPYEFRILYDKIFNFFHLIYRL